MILRCGEGAANLYRPKLQPPLPRIVRGKGRLFLRPPQCHVEQDSPASGNVAALSPLR